jgi:hypothetical protein
MTGTTPQSIRWFEGLSLAALLLGLLNVFAGPETSWTFVVLVDGTMIALILLVSRGRKNWARWLLAGMYVLGLAFMLWQMRALMNVGMPLITLGVTLLQTIALVMLFTPDSAAWFRKQGVAG